MKKLLSIILCAALIVCAFAFNVSADDTMENVSISFTDGAQTLSTNPGRGVAAYMDTKNWVICGGGNTYTGLLSDFDEHGIYTPMFELSAFSSGNDYVYDDGGPSCADNPSAYVGGTNKDIDTQTLDAIRGTLENVKANGAVCILRFAYDKNGAAGCEPDDVSWILRHIDQLSDVINQYKGTVISIECGMLGPWGEMHDSKYIGKSYGTYGNQNKVIGEWLKRLDPTVSVQVRSASFIVNYLETVLPKFKKLLPLATDNPAYRLSMFNDGYLYDANDCGTWCSTTSTESANMYRSTGITLLSSQASRAPYGGELGYASSVQVMKDGKSPVYENDFLHELYDTHLSYLRNIEHSQTVANELRTLMLTTDYDTTGLPDVSEYIGKSLNKFMVDHMGYRFVVKEAKQPKETAPGSTALLTGKVENTGFGNILFSTESELVLVDAENHTTVIPAYIDASDWKSNTVNDYKIQLSVPQTATGKYDVYLRVATNKTENSRTASSGAIQFANEGIFDASVGGNYIGSINVTGNKGGYATQFAQANDARFIDVKPGAWYENAVYGALSSSLISGTSDSIFAPEVKTSRAMLVQVLYNAEGKPDVSGVTLPFSDVKDGDWFAKAIKWAYSNKIVAGTSDTTYSPNGDITREQFAAILYRYASYKSVDVTAQADISAFTDSTSISAYALTALKWANAEGFITGMSDTILNPRGSATRAQMASILVRYVKAHA